jgi:hypothetical protein
MQVNGAMDICQGSSAPINVGAPTFIIDCFYINKNGSMVIGAQRGAGSPNFPNTISYYVTTAQAVIGAADYLALCTGIEGYRIARLRWGTPNAMPLSFAFSVYALRPGTYSGCVRNGGGTRSCPFNFTINAGSTWEYKTVTIPGDTAGTWNFVNSTGIIINWAAAVGSSFAGAAGAWVNGNLLGTPGSTNGVAAVTDGMSITGLIVLPGLELPSAAAVPLIMRPSDQELILCRRYLQRSFQDTVAIGASTTSQLYGRVHLTQNDPYIVAMLGSFSPTMRVAPTMTVYSPNSGNPGRIFNATAGSDFTALGVAASEKFFSIQGDGSTTIAAGPTSFNAHFVADARMF